MTNVLEVLVLEITNLTRQDILRQPSKSDKATNLCVSIDTLLFCEMGMVGHPVHMVAIVCVGSQQQKLVY